MRGLSHVTLGNAAALVVSLLVIGPGAREALARPDCIEQGNPGKSDDGTWRVLRTSGAAPSGRSAPAVAAQGSWIYVFGGSHDDVVSGEVTLAGDFFRFDTVRRRWHEVRALGTQPPARAFSAMVNDPDSDRLVMYGGATFGEFFSDFVALEDLWVFEPRGNAWSEVRASNTGPGGRSGATLFIDDGKLYVFGGIDSFFQTHNDVWSYEFTTQTWSEVIADGDAASPPPRHEAYSGGTMHDGKVTLYGGETVTEDFNFVTLPDTWQYDVEARKWTELTPAPRYDIDPPRNLGAAALVGDALYIHGGDVPGGELCGAVFAQNPTDELWRFDLRRERWEQLSPHGSSVARLKRSRGVEVGGAMYIVGGYDFQCADGAGSQVWNESVFLFQPSRGGRRN